MVNAITYILANNSTVQGLVGNKNESQTDTYYKVYPVVAPYGEKAPYIAVRQTGKVEACKNGGYTYTVQIVSYATSYDDVTTLNDAIISAISSQANGTVNGFDFGFVNITNEQDDYVKEHSLYAKILTVEGNGG